MKSAEIAINIQNLIKNRPANEEFIYELLLAYGSPKSGITLLKKGTRNLAKNPDEVLWKNKVYFKPVETQSLLDAMEELKKSPLTKTNKPRFLVATDFKQILAIDQKKGDTLDTSIDTLDAHYNFFFPWAGMEKIKLSNENPADVKAAEKMAKLFDAIKKDNPDYLQEDPHSMNVFLGRLLFCLFAEDTGIFPENAVTNAIASHTVSDGSDLDRFFKQLFDWLDTSDSERKSTTESVDDNTIQKLPYVNGGLFRDHFDIPTFSAQSRRMIIAAGELNWAEINPDIFGSMFQAVIDPEERHNLGQHYTSVTNIMKVIEPLFLNDFKANLEKAQEMTRGKKQALHRLLDRIAKVKIFDPACGSGNFLIIAYKELRKLEMEVFKELQSIEGAFPISRMSVSQFYGIEIADFACETAILALWLAEHQMNLEYKKIFGKTLVSLPLKEGANIVCGNATRLDWEVVCPKTKDSEIYILGNPPYLGFSLQNEEQRVDMQLVFSAQKNYKRLDYICCWFQLASNFIHKVNAKAAFVSTNSICQGEQVALLWPQIFKRGLEIGFAHQSFKWNNNAKNNAAVICVIIGLRNVTSKDAILFRYGVAQSVNKINAYLTSGNNVMILKRGTPLSKIPVMLRGDMPIDGGNFIFSTDEKVALCENYPNAKKFVRKFIGASEFMKSTCRWCLWITDDVLNEALKIEPIRLRLDAVKATRMVSKNKSTQELAETPYRFGQIRHVETMSIIIPSTTSERRAYIPLGFINSYTIISNLAYSIPSADPCLFGVLSSRLHMVWVRAVAGRLKSDYRYSSGMCYHTFPIPELTEKQKETITKHVMKVLAEREAHSEKTMAQLYDPDKMPDGLHEAHHQLDLAVDRLYRSKPFTSDEERLEHLFKLYEEMIQKEKLI